MWAAGRSWAGLSACSERPREWIEDGRFRACTAYAWWVAAGPERRCSARASAMRASGVAASAATGVSCCAIETTDSVFGKGRQLGVHLAKGGVMRCEEIMKRDVTTVWPSDTVQTAARHMRDANVGFL